MFKKKTHLFFRLLFAGGTGSGNNMKSQFFSQNYFSSCLD